MEYFARSHVVQTGPSFLPTIVEQERFQGYLHIVATVPLIYDALITMDREVEFVFFYHQIMLIPLEQIKHFWKVPRKPVDFVYFANRYVGILGALAFSFALTLSADLKKCNFAVWTQDIASWLTLVLTDYVLTIRVLALYYRDRTLTFCLCSFLAVEAAATLGTVLYGHVFASVTVGRVEGVSTCGIDRRPPWQFGIVYWSAPLAYAIILMVLALYKAAEFWRLSAGFKGFALVKVLIEDQVIYFMAVILVSVFAMLFFCLQTSNPIVETLGNPLFLCIPGSRMLLNLKEAGERGQNEGTSFVPPLRTMSDIEFGQPPANVEDGGN